MKKITFIFGILLACSQIYAQNLVSNGDFEATVGTYTVAESGTGNVLKRVSSIYDTSIQGTNPNATAGEAVSTGQWVKRALDETKAKAVIVTTGAYAGTSCLNLKVATTNNTAYTNSLSLLAVQRISGLDNTKRYKVTFWAKQDATSTNNCQGVNLVLGDNTIQSVTNPLMVGVILTGGTTWTQYTAVLDLPKYITSNPTANFSTSVFGFAITVKTTSAAAGVLIDDVVMEEFTGYAVKFVKPSATGTGDGSSWENASANLQAMIDDIEHGEVRVAAGLYKPTVTINLKDGVNLIGGYDVNGLGSRNVLLNKTILDGNGDKRIIQNSNSTNPFRYLTKVDGFILQNGYSDNGSAASLSLGAMLENCIIRNNTGTAKGAAVYFARNTIISGSGYSKNFQQTGSVFNSLIINNSSVGGAGAIYGESSTLYSVVNCVIANNKCTEATTGTGGIYIGGSSQWTQLQNNIFYNNSGASDALNNIRNMSTTTLSAAICNWFDNTTMPVSFTVGGSSISTGNKTNSDISSPAFILPTTFQGAPATVEQVTELENSDWRLQNTSGMIGIGNSTQGIKFPYENFHAILVTTPALAFTNITKDLAGNNRIYDTTVDLGAFEYQPVVTTTISDKNEQTQTDFIKMNGRVLTKLNSSCIDVYNIAGTLIQKADRSTTTITLPSAGVYVLKVTDNNRTMKFKLMVY